MLSQFALFYGGLVGFVLAGCTACAFEYVTNRRLEFDIGDGAGFSENLVGFFIRIIAGPYLVARFVADLMDEGLHPLIVLGGSLLVVAWSLASGVLFVASFLG